MAVVVETPNRSTISRWVMKGWSAENSPRAMEASSSALTQAKRATPGGGVGGGRPSGAVNWSLPVDRAEHTSGSRAGT
jgi:hypothetical protein